MTTPRTPRRSYRVFPKWEDIGLVPVVPILSECQRCGWQRTWDGFTNTTTYSPTGSWRLQPTEGAMSTPTPEHRAELRRALHYSGQPNFAVERDIIAALLDAADERDRLAAAAEQVRALHTGSWGCGNPSHTNPDVSCPDCFIGCDACGELHPCPTIHALDGSNQ